ncbi:MAG: signal peptidase I [Clostridia bacterium]|nr:signal peptidase I [Clostridia bacterium]
MENDNKNTQRAQEQVSVSTKTKVLNIVGICLCVILLPILILNCVLIIKDWSNSKEVPSIGNTVPLIVITESMEPQINGGDLIVVKKVDAQTLKVGDVIAFYDPVNNFESVVTHKIDEIVYESDGTTIKEVKTYGINNFNADGTQAKDGMPVPVKAVIGIYKGTRIPFIGSVAMFMQSTWGLIVCIFLPLAAFIGYEVYRRYKVDKATKSDMDALLAELEALKQTQADVNKESDSDKSEN